MSLLITALDGPLAIVDETDGRTLVLTGENSAYAAQKALEAAQSALDATTNGAAQVALAQDIADEVDAALALLNLFSGSAPGVSVAIRDAVGQVVAEILDPSGRVRLFGLLDQEDRDIFAALTDAEAMIADLQERAALLPLIQRARLKKSLEYGSERQVYTVDPITVAATTAASTMTSPVTIAKDDSRIRFLGGRWMVGTAASPSAEFYNALPILNGAKTSISGNTGYPNGATANINMVQFTLPAGQTIIELKLRNLGSNQEVFVEIDGVSTNANGYTLGFPATRCYTKITFPASTSDRVITIHMPGRPWGDMLVETGGTIGDKPAQRTGSTLALMADSIGAGNAASDLMKTWIKLVCDLLGIDELVNLGVGGSGWEARFPSSAVTVSTTSGSASVAVISGTLVAGDYISGPGIPRDAKVTVGAAAGGTATISAAAAATAGSIAVRNEAGRNFRDRINDMLMAISPATGNTATVTFTSGSSDVTVTGGILPAGAFIQTAITDGHIPVATKVLTGATAGGTAVLSEQATASGSVLIEIGLPPDVLVISGGYNDASFFDLTTDFPAQVLATLQALRAAAPDMQMFVTGCWTDYNNPTYPAPFTTVSAAIEAAAGQVRNVNFIDVSGAVTPDNVDTVFNGVVNGAPHPVDAGHAIYAATVYSAMSAVIGGW